MGLLRKKSEPEEERAREPVRQFDREDYIQLRSSSKSKVKNKSKGDEKEMAEKKENTMKSNEKAPAEKKTAKAAEKKDTAKKAAAPAEKKTSKTAEKTPTEKKTVKAAEKKDTAKKAADSTEKKTSKTAEKKDTAAKTNSEKPAAKKNADEKSKVWHITKRDDVDKWQVKAEGNEKATKLFRTKAEAQEYVKSLSANNEGSRVVSHKKDGKFQKK